jgi:hypothetical protein
MLLTQRRRRRAERGRSLFEGVLRNYPKRLDLWSVYLDQEVAQGDQQRIRWVAVCVCVCGGLCGLRGGEQEPWAALQASRSRRWLALDPRSRAHSLSLRLVGMLEWWLTGHGYA